MKKTLVLLGLMAMSIPAIFTQDVSLKPPGNWVTNLHIESGFVYPDGTIRENIAIRQNISSYYVYQSSSGYISSSTTGFIAGLRCEFFNKKLKTGISSGLRYTGYNSEISGFTSSNADFFYLRYAMMNSDTKFARVKAITETNNFISIPLEIRFIPIQFKGIGLFAKAGIECSIVNLKKATDIDFQDSNMEVNQEIILSEMGISNQNFFSTLYGSIGVKLGEESRPNYMFEVFLPSLYLTKNNFALTEVAYYDGFKFSILFPITKRP